MTTLWIAAIAMVAWQPLYIFTVLPWKLYCGRR